VGENIATFGKSSFPFHGSACLVWREKKRLRGREKRRRTDIPYSNILYCNVSEPLEQESKRESFEKREKEKKENWIIHSLKFNNFPPLCRL